MLTKPSPVPRHCSKCFTYIKRPKSPNNPTREVSSSPPFASVKAAQRGSQSSSCDVNHQEMGKLCLTCASDRQLFELLMFSCH